MSDYWADRTANAQNAISDKTIKQIERQLKRYYGITMGNVIKSFESTYNQLLNTLDEGETASPANLYKLDKYWEMQGQLRRELQKLGDKQIAILSKNFELNFFDVYYSLNIEGVEAFKTIDSKIAQQIINQIWCADGKSWSQRVWDNTDLLQQTLNDELVDCAIAGKKTSDLKKVLQERFNVSYSRADAVVRTEMAHIQTQAAKQRYNDYGIEQVQVWASEDERRCPECAKLHKKKYPANGHIPIPAHPNCRCCIIPVVDDNELEENNMENKFTKTCVRCGKEFNTDYDHVKICPECAAQTEARNKRVIEEAKNKKIKQLQSHGMTNENLNIVKQAWENGRVADVSELKTYKRKCAYCGGYLQSIYQRGKVYHENCLKYKEFDDLQEIVTCVDCGEDFIRYKKYKNQIRCPECQAKYRKEYKARKERARRAKNKKK